MESGQRVPGKKNGFFFPIETDGTKAVAWKVNHAQGDAAPPVDHLSVLKFSVRDHRCSVLFQKGTFVRRNVASGRPGHGRVVKVIAMPRVIQERRVIFMDEYLSGACGFHHRVSPAVIAVAVGIENQTDIRQGQAECLQGGEYISLGHHRRPRVNENMPVACEKVKLDLDFAEARAHLLESWIYAHTYLPTPVCWSPGRFAAFLSP